MTTGLKMSNLGLRFLLELAALAAVAYWGFVMGATPALRILLGIGGLVLFAVVWGVFASPRAPAKLTGAARVALEIVFFGLAAALLAVAGQPVLAVLLAGVFAINWILLVRWGLW